ncbi:hypothetical protein L1887_10009 [Cichorium endivia]|nr:hypothetical protein L1887_10009 [Cichorium endivia]
MALVNSKSSASKSASKRRNYSSSDSDDDYSSVVNEGGSGTLDLHHTPLVSKYDDRIRPLLNCIDRLRHLKVMQEGIQLPTIVVVGDQSSGKSSVLENRVGKESYEEARIKEAKLFETNPLLSLVDKSMVGIPVLAEKLVEIQSTIISKCLPDIVSKINDKLTGYVDQLNKLPRKMTSIAEAMTALMRIIGSVKESLRKILIRGEFEEYPDVRSMHGTARLSEMLDEYSAKLQATTDNEGNGCFLMEEIRVLEEAKGIGLPNFLPRAAFLTLLNKRVNEQLSSPC